MFSKVAVLAFVVAFAAAQNWVGVHNGVGGIQEFGGVHGFGGGEVEDHMILKNLVRLDAVNRPLARRLLQLDVADREVVGALARGINHVIIKKGNMYPLTLWDRVLKIKGNVHNEATNNIENNWVQTEIDDKEILEDLMKVDNVDRQIVTSLLWTDVVDRKIVADLAQAINHKVVRHGPSYTHFLHQKVAQINGDVWGTSGHLGNVWGISGHLGNTWGTTGHLGNTWSTVGSLGNTWGTTHPFGNIWGTAGQHGGAWGVHNTPLNWGIHGINQW